MKYARIYNNVVAEIIETDGDIKEMFHPSIELVACDNKVKCGDSYDGGKFVAYVPVVIDPREDMVISKVKAMQNLKAAGKLNIVLDLMDALPRDNDVRILWDFSEKLHRTDPALIEFCKKELGLDELGIDDLFL